MLTDEDGAAVEGKRDAGGAVGVRRWRQHDHSCSDAQHRVSATIRDGTACCSGIRTGGHSHVEGSHNTSQKCGHSQREVSKRLTWKGAQRCQRQEARARQHSTGAPQGVTW